jgi:PadR family transcriptional regulator PadR
VTPRREFSPQALLVLAALREQPSQWQHGYALAERTGLKSGTLYPVLIRLADRRLVEACWQQEPAPGRPRRHQYRLTAGGLARAAALAAPAPRPQARPTAPASARQAAWRGAAAPAAR